MQERLAQRGQGMVEAALGMLVFVTVLVFGVHFAEVAFLTLKTQEAAVVALWDVSGRQHHQYPDGDRKGAAAAETSAQVTERYADFDGYGTSGGTSITQLFSRATGMSAVCQATDFYSMAEAEAGMAIFGPINPSGGVTCEATSSIGIYGFTRYFYDDRFSQAHVQGTGTWTSCGVGPLGDRSPCKKFAILIDDYGLNGGSEKAACLLSSDGQPCANAGYYELVRRAFAGRMGGAEQIGRAAVELAEAQIGTSPITEPWEFFLSAPSFETQHLDPGTHVDESNQVFSGTPGPRTLFTDQWIMGDYAKMYGGRSDNWLGLPP